MTLSGNQYEISAGPYEAIVTEQGATLRALVHDGRRLVIPHGPDEPPPGAGGQLLAPWPNRIDQGRYTFEGTTHRLPVDEPEFDTAIHGLVRFAPWVAAEREPHRVLLTYRLLGYTGYPFRLDLSVEYSLDAGSGLTVRQSVRNTGTNTAPYGHGGHPYLAVELPLDACDLTISGGRFLETDERNIPVGDPRDVADTAYDFRESRRIGDTVINHAYTDLTRDADGRAWVRLQGGGRSVALWADEAHPWLEIYTRDDVWDDTRRTGLGAEPMTCPPNAFVSGTDLIALRPDEEFGGSWGVIAD